MKLNRGRLIAFPAITDAHCDCGNTLKEVSNGFISSAWFCTKCETVYVLELVKVKSKAVTNEFLKQCREDAQKI
jgi:hypothetical protein